MKIQTILGDKFNELLTFIECCHKHNISTSGGNCGTFALALAEIYNKPCEIIMCHQTADVNELEHGEPYIYHIITRLNNTLLDGTGITTVDDLFNIAEHEYNDYDADDTTFEYPAEKTLIERIVRNNTDKTINVTQYVKYFNDLKNSGKLL